jgi:hypothetical protein
MWAQLAAALGGQDRDPTGRGLAAREQSAAAKEEYAARLLRAKVSRPNLALPPIFAVSCVQLHSLCFIAKPQSLESQC